MPITYSTDSITRITFARLTDEQLRRARVLGGQRSFAGIEELELDGERCYGRLVGEAVRGFALSPLVHPTLEQAERQRVADSFGADATAARIDAQIRERREALDREASRDA